ncbi:MAG: DNA-methyltransferase [Nitrososphaerales archaeon]
MLDDIICCDSRDISFIRDGYVALTVTSPPYHNAIDYTKHLEKKWYRGNLGKSLDIYLAEMETVFSEVFRATKEGGYCCIIIGNEVAAGNIIPLPHLLTEQLSKRWRFQEEIIWSKVTGGLDRFGVTIQHPYPSYYRANIMHEHILIFRKGRLTHKKDEDSRLVIDEVMKKDTSNSVWKIPPVPPNFIDHPCPFPEEIPFRLTLLYSNKGDVVLDPFNGSGQTTKVAKHLERHYIGIDTQPKYVALAKKRLSEPLHLREQIVAEWKKISKPLSYEYQKV